MDEKESSLELIKDFINREPSDILASAGAKPCEEDESLSPEYRKIYAEVSAETKRARREEAEKLRELENIYYGKTKR